MGKIQSQKREYQEGVTSELINSFSIANDIQINITIFYLLDNLLTTFHRKNTIEKY